MTKTAEEITQLNKEWSAKIGEYVEFWVTEPNVTLDGDYSAQDLRQLAEVLDQLEEES